ncbi:hypothetical protein BDY19DRAFT_990123 [Irpex rosettiformis]|uniref:Uncharacterized protein n=1 Tax=Irpex rosettiformis TaxID=378272 RepID=A0ACB8UH41_9APHY|nr:hypothetical protein BDY19DRAFT_990123 [Irpex rosettiformis]
MYYYCASILIPTVAPFPASLDFFLLVVIDSSWTLYRVWVSSRHTRKIETASKKARRDEEARQARLQATERKRLEKHVAEMNQWRNYTPMNPPSTPVRSSTLAHPLHSPPQFSVSYTSSPTFFYSNFPSPSYTAPLSSPEGTQMPPPTPFLPFQAYPTPSSSPHTHTQQIPTAYFPYYPTTPIRRPSAPGAFIYPTPPFTPIASTSSFTSIASTSESILQMNNLSLTNSTVVEIGMCITKMSFS